MNRLKEIAKKDTLSLADREYLEKHCREVTICEECMYSIKIKNADDYFCKRLNRAVCAWEYCSRGENNG